MSGYINGFAYKFRAIPRGMRGDHRDWYNVLSAGEESATHVARERCRIALALELLGRVMDHVWKMRF